MTLEDRIKEEYEDKGLNELAKALRDFEKLAPFIAIAITMGIIVDTLMDIHPEDFQIEKKEPINEFLYYKNPKEWLYIKKCQ